MVVRGDIEARRARVAEGLLARTSQRQLAQELGVSRPTIARDAAAIRAEWRQHRLAAAQSLVDMELARLDRLEHVWWPVAQKQARAAELLLKISERRSRLLGLDAPPRQHIQVDIKQARILAAEFGVPVEEIVGAYTAVVERARPLLEAGLVEGEARVVR